MEQALLSPVKILVSLGGTKHTVDKTRSVLYQLAAKDLLNGNRVLLCFINTFLFSQRYNKREEDFPTLDEYNDFLEEIEEIGKS